MKNIFIGLISVLMLAASYYFIYVNIPNDPTLPPIIQWGALSISYEAFIHVSFITALGVAFIGLLKAILGGR